jgi:hypothetical protein
MFHIITSYKKEGLDEKKHENKKLSNKSIQCQKEKNIIFNSTKMHVFVDDCDIFQTRGCHYSMLVFDDFLLSRLKFKISFQIRFNIFIYALFGFKNVCSF